MIALDKKKPLKLRWKSERRARQMSLSLPNSVQSTNASLRRLERGPRFKPKSCKLWKGSYYYLTSWFVFLMFLHLGINCETYAGYPLNTSFYWAISCRQQSADEATAAMLRAQIQQLEDRKTELKQSHEQLLAKIERITGDLRAVAFVFHSLFSFSSLNLSRSYYPSCFCNPPLWVFSNWSILIF